MSEKLNRDPLYMLALLIEIYRGINVILPEFDPVMEKNTLMDVFSTAIRFATQEESLQVLTGEIGKCAAEGSTVKEQMQLIHSQHPDLLNAKMVAAAHLMNQLNGQGTKSL